MIPYQAIFGDGRVGSWRQADPLTRRGRFEERDAAGTVGRLCDWVEASVLFLPDGVASATDVEDELLDSGSVPEEELTGISEAVLAELERRAQHLSVSQYYPFRLADDVLERLDDDWCHRIDYAFLLVASVAQNQPTLITDGSSYDEVGHLFEALAAHSYSGIFGSAARVVPVRKGLPREEDHLALRLAPILESLGLESNESLRQATMRVNDGGLDLLARFDLGDSRAGGAFVLVQCSSGLNWASKLHTPTRATWRDWVDWRGPIWRSFCVPFIFKDDRTLRDASRDGEWQLILDRSRLIRGCLRSGTIEQDLQDSLSSWVRDRLPRLLAEAS